MKLKLHHNLRLRIGLTKFATIRVLNHQARQRRKVYWGRKWMHEEKQLFKEARS